MSEKGFQGGLCLRDYHTCWEQMWDPWRLAPRTPQTCVRIHLDGNKGVQGVSIVRSELPAAPRPSSSLSSRHALPHILHSINTSV